MRRRSRDDFGTRTRRELALKRILNRYPDQSGMELSNAFLGSDGPLETGALGETGAPGSTGSGAASTRSFSPADLEGSEETRLRELLAELATQAQTASFRVAPNPCVGAAVLSDGVEIGRGIHDAWGGPHAEVAAFAAARASGVDEARWDTLVVTLEPCSTEGKTPPCTDAILAAGIKRVVVAELDPDPRHRGRGLELLQSSGVEVLHLVKAAPLVIHAPYFVRWTGPERLRRRRPWTVAKWAQTRTGQLTPPEDVGEGRWISSPESLAHVQELRATMGAIVTGIGTVRADDPRLTVRIPGAEGPGPLRVVLDTELRLSPDARLFEAPAEGEVAGPVHVFTRPGHGALRRHLEERGATVHTVRLGDDGRLSLRDVAGSLWKLGVRRALLECGPKLMLAWFASELVDQIRVYTGAVNGGRGPTLAEVLRPQRLEGVVHGEVGPDSILEAFVKG